MERIYLKEEPSIEHLTQSSISLILSVQSFEICLQHDQIGQFQFRYEHRIFKFGRKTFNEFNFVFPFQFFITLIVYAVYSLPLDETNPNEKQPTDKNDQPSKVSLVEPQVLLNQERSQYPQHPQQKREFPSGGEPSVPEDDQPTKHKKREAIDEPPKKGEKNERKLRDTTNQKWEPNSNQKPSERKTRDIKQIDTKPEVPAPEQTKHVIRSVRDDSGKELDTSNTGKEPPKPLARQRRHTHNDQKPDENVKHIDEDKDHPSKSTIKRSAEKSGDNVPKPNPGNEKKN